jgi:hypothetical protein
VGEDPEPYDPDQRVRQVADAYDGLPLTTGYVDRRLREVFLAEALFGGLPGLTVTFMEGPDYPVGVPRGAVLVEIVQQLPGPPERQELHGMVQLPTTTIDGLHPTDLAMLVEAWADGIFRPWLRPDDPMPELVPYPRLRWLEERWARARGTWHYWRWRLPQQLRLMARPAYHAPGL